MKYLLTILALCMAQTVLPTDAQTRIRDIVDIEGVRDNDLVGYGIVVGLNGSGDSVRNAPYTEDTLSHMLERLGVNVQGEDIKPANVAAVLVTAKLPSFARAGSTIDISVASIGDADSLEGGTLILAPLKGANNEVYAVAQGNVVVGGLDVQANGARVEREIGYLFNARDTVQLSLRSPDFTTAARIEDTINRHLNLRAAAIRDPGTIDIDLTNIAMSPARFLADIENLSIAVATPARIVIDERSGTIVLGEDVTISKVAIAQGNITVKVRENPVAVQPNPFGGGDTIVLPRTDIQLEQNGNQNVVSLGSTTTLSQLIDGLNALGVSPPEMADIIRTMRTAGAIHADLIIQ
jgi:flagellar P-ring protein precursor FlgI